MELLFPEHVGLRENLLLVVHVIGFTLSAWRIKEEGGRYAGGDLV